ncbi:MAG: hypothetical protein GY944_14130, partial [bacterium]|nr:hypothetical protein [bacterium]
GIEGFRVANVGATLVIVPQKSRLANLVDTAKKPPADGSVDLGPLTPPMQAVIDQPAIGLGYLLMSDDGTLLNYVAWLMSGGYNIFS